MKKSFLKIRFICALLLVCVILPCALADTTQPYDTYNYDYWNNILYTPSPYTLDFSVSGATLLWQGAPLGDLKAPRDLCVADDGKLYIADTGNNRVVIVDKDLKTVLGIVDGFVSPEGQQTFSAPYGVAVSQNGQLYVADSQNHRIVVLELDGTFVKYVMDPKGDVLDEKFVFTPLRVSVDYADRVYCVAQNTFQGIMVFSSEGDFTGFFGTINVKISLWEKIWRRLSTKAERSKQQLFIPTEFTGIDVDSEGFIYASNKDTDGIQAVRRLNPKGEDVILRGSKENLGGDLVYGQVGNYSGPSQIVDVVYREHGIYSLLDARRGRVFTYDHEGNLLYIFGGMGTQDGTFTSPVAIEQAGERLLVLDNQQGSISVFAQTEYGSLINRAVGLRYDGDEGQAVPLWEEVLRLDENNELANAGIGKAYLSAGDNENAMVYLRRGMNRTYFSVAFKRWRNEVLRNNFSWILTGVVVLVLAFVVWKKLVSPKLLKRAKKDVNEKARRELPLNARWRYLFYTVFHPNDGFYWIRHQERGSVWIALLLVIVYAVAFSCNRIYSSFVVNDIEPRSVNLIAEMAGVLILYFILCVGNWSVTCLMEGEGRFKDILIVIGYSLVPMICTTVLATAASQAVAENEEAFYYILMGLGMAYSLILMLIGIMQVHNYTLGKTLITLFITVIAVFIIIFLAMLVLNFITQVYSFLRNIYTELIFRT